MMQAPANGHVVESLRAQSELEMAKAILIGLRRRGPAAGHRELFDAAKRRSWGVNGSATALVRHSRQTALERGQGNGNDLVAGLYHLDHITKKLQRRRNIMKFALKIIFDAALLFALLYAAFYLMY